MKPNSPKDILQLVEKVDSLPTDKVTVVYTKTRFTQDQYRQLIHSLMRIRETSELGEIIVMPYEDMEIKTLTEDDRLRLGKLLGFVTEEMEGKERIRHGADGDSE